MVFMSCAVGVTLIIGTIVVLEFRREGVHPGMVVDKGGCGIFTNI